MTDSNDLYFRCIVYNGCAGGGYVCVVRTTTGLVKYHIHCKSISKNNCHNDIYHIWKENEFLGTTGGIISFQHNLMSTSVLNKYYTFTRKVM